MYYKYLEKIKNILRSYKLFRLINYKYKNAVYKNLFNLKLNENSVVLDFGANIGSLSQCLLDLYNCNIYCYEPDISTFKILEKRFKSSKKVKVVNKAVGTTNGKSYLYYHKFYNDENPIAYSTGSSLLKEKDNVNAENYQTINTASIDDILKKFEIIDLIKINIEGYEYELFPYLFKNKYKIKKVLCALHGDPNKSGNKFLNEKYNKFIKELNEIDPQRKWFLNHD